MSTFSQKAVLLAVALAVAGGSSTLAATKKKTATQPVDNSPVVTPDTTSLPTGTAAPTGMVQVGAIGSSPAPVQAYSIPVGGAGQAQATPARQVASAPQAAPTPQGPPEPPVMARAEACLRTNLETVARAEPSPKLAVDLLLTDVCAADVDAASLYVRNLDALARFNPVSERGRAGLSTARVDPETGQILAPPSVDVSTAVDVAERRTLVIAPSLRTYAAELVLNEKLRIAATGKKSR